MANKDKKKYLRSSVARGLENGVDSIDRENNIIRGFSVVSKGEAIGHHQEIDDITLQQVTKLGNKSKIGIKSRFGHPNASGTALGTFVGRVKGFKQEDDRVRADLHIDDTAFETPNGDLATYVMDLAESDPDAFGASIVFPIGFDEENDPDTGLRDKDGDLMTLARVTQLNGVDVVDDTATGDGLFGELFNGTTVQLSVEMTTALDELFQQENALELAESFIDKYVHNEERREKLKGKAIEIMAAKNKHNKNKLIFQLSQEETMADKKDKKEPGTPAVEQTELTFSAASVAEREELAKEQERGRIEEITVSCDQLKLDTEFATQLINDGISIDDARKQMLEKAREQMKSGAVNTNIKIKNDGHQVALDGMSDAILVRAGLEKDQKIIADVNKSEFRGMSLQNLAKKCLMSDSISESYMYDGNQLYQSMVENQYFSQAPTQGSGDFVNVLSNVLNKSVNLGWATAASTFETWVGTGQLKDFKTADLVRLSEYGDIEQIQEGEAPKMAKMTDTKEQTRLQTFGSKFILTRQAMVNDDLAQFTTIPVRKLRSLRRKMNKLAYGLVYNDNGNSAAFNGPTMLEDDIAMFDEATHTNLVPAASGAAPGQTTLDAAFVAMMNLRALTPDGGRSEDIFMNVGPEFLICGPKNQLAAYKLFQNIGYNVTGDEGAAEGTIASNIFGPGQPRNLKVVIDAELDNINASYYPWYLATNPQDVGHITLYTLNGQTTPFTEVAPTPTGDARGMIWVLEHDFRFAQTDWRGMYCNSGAAK